VRQAVHDKTKSRNAPNTSNKKKKGGGQLRSLETGSRDGPGSKKQAQISSKRVEDRLIWRSVGRENMEDSRKREKSETRAMKVNLAQKRDRSSVSP